MKKIHTYFCIGLLVLLVGNSFSQIRKINFNLVSGTNGVSLGKINGMTRDKYGFMWFSDQTTGSIIRYDGSHMTQFIHNPNNPNTLGGPYPECLATDDSGNIWIGFTGMGLDKFNPATNTFTHYRHKDDPQILSNDTVSAVLVDHLGNVWVGSNGGADVLEMKTGKFKHYANDAKDSTTLSYNIVRGLYEDKDGEVWVGTGFTWENNEEGGLNRFNRNTGTFTRYLHSHQTPNSLSNNKVRAMLEDSYGNFWIGTANNGLHTLDKRTGKITRYPFLPAKNNGLGIPKPAAYDDNVTFIVEDVERKIWIGTMWSGIIRYDPPTKEMIRYGTKEDKTNALQDSMSWWAHATPDGIMWVSTQNSKLYRADVHNVSIQGFIINPGYAVSAINEENSTVVWYGTTNGLFRKDNKEGTVKHFLNKPGDPNSLSSNVINDLLRDKTGNLWISTDNALNFYDNKQGIFKRYYRNTGNNLLINSRLLCLSEDVNGNIWAGTDVGLLMFDPKTEKFSEYKHNPVDGTTISGSVITSLVVDGEHTIWVGTENNGGLNKLDIQTRKISHYMPGMTIWCMYKSIDGIIWVGTPTGLFFYDAKLDRFASLAETNAGLNIVLVESIIEDKENNLWVAGENGLYMVNKARDGLVRYGEANGLHDANNTFSFEAAIRRQDGELQFGYWNGYYSFYPGRLRSAPTTNQLFFTGLWLNNKKITPGNSGPLTEAIDIAKEIRLSHSQNIFSISATMIDFRNSSDKRIFYKLENYDNDWRSTNPEEHIQYFKVPPGKYTFRIKAANGTDGGWQEKSIVISILPPWWSTWWAYCLYGVLFIVLVILIHRYQKNQVIKSERERTRARQLEQAKEIEKAYHQLKETQAQLVQQEKMASLGELTAGIAHEIQNPLNFVNNFSEVNDELLKELNTEAEKGNLEEVKAIAKNIQFNSEKINHHGKRADSIVKGMLQHSRTSTGQKESTDINALCDEYLRLAYHGLRAKDKAFNATMKTDFDLSIGKTNVVPQEIGRVILNLINNAFYAVDEKKKQIGDGYEPTVSISTEKNKGKVEVSVRDNGNGIPQKVLDKIFQPFFTTKPTGQGTGLGLSLAYDIITKGHGGELKVETKEGEGSEFIIQLPGI